MSLEVKVYTLDEDGQRRTVRGIDFMKIQKEWQAQLIQNVALFAAIPPPLVRAMKEERDEILARFANIADAVNEAIELGGGVVIK